MKEDPRIALLQDLRAAADELRCSRSVQSLRAVEAILGKLRWLYSDGGASEKLRAIRTYAGWLRSPATCSEYGGPEDTYMSILGAIGSLDTIRSWDKTPENP